MKLRKDESRESISKGSLVASQKNGRRGPIFKSTSYGAAGPAKPKRLLRAAAAAGSPRREKFMTVEAEALLASAKRARLFEHNTNRGSDAEEAIRRWLKMWLEPQYTISAGEIIDSVEEAGVPVSRQQDGIIHVNSLEARRYTLPSGLRLVPVERV